MELTEADRASLAALALQPLIQPYVSPVIPHLTDVGSVGAPLVGRGWSTLVDLPGGQLVLDAAAESPVDSTSFFTAIAESRSDYSLKVSGSARAKFDGIGWGASARTSLSRDYKRSLRSVDIVMSKLVTKRKYYIPLPVKSLAKDSHTLSVRDFQRRYGDQWVSEVVMGATLLIVYSLEFASQSAAENFRFQAEGKYGSGRGGVDFHRSVIEKSQASTIRLSVVSRGVASIPSFFTRRDEESEGTATLYVRRSDDQQVAQLLGFFEEFEEIAANSPGLIPVDFTSEDVATLPSGRTDVALNAEKRLFDEAALLDDELDDLRSQLEYLSGPAKGWNPTVPENEVNAQKAALDKADLELKDFVRRLASLDKTATRLPAIAVPRLPPSWIARDLTRKAFTPPQTYRNSGFRQRLAIPALTTGQGVKLLWSIGAANGSGYAGPVDTLCILTTAGGKRQVIENWFRLPNTNGPERTIEHTLPYSENLEEIIVEGSTYDGRVTEIFLAVLG